ncbi:MAG: DUF6325 family protein [Motilibacteraceae bacterium]
MTASDVRQGREIDELGPIDYLVLEFPEGQYRGEAFGHLLDLVDRRLIRVLDLVFLHRTDEGQVRVVAPSELPVTGFDASVFDGAASGLLGADDVAAVGEVVEPGHYAGLLVFENSWAAPFATAARRGGAALVATGRIPTQAVLAALDELDAATSAPSQA